VKDRVERQASREKRERKGKKTLASADRFPPIPYLYQNFLGT
jgi:hypothetical protein